MAFKFEADVNGKPKELVALFAQDPNDPHIRSRVNGRAINLSLSKGIPGFEQGVAVSYDPPVVLAEFAKGKNLYGLSLSERHSIPQDHWDRLFANADAASARGILIDANTDNFIYDPESGFTVIDFQNNGGRESTDVTLATNRARLRKFHDLVMSSEPITQN